MKQVRYALRGLRQNPSFSIPAVVALALGVGSVTAIFSVVDCVLLRPLPYPRADRLVSVTTFFPSDNVETLVSTEYLNWSRDNRVLENLAAFTGNAGSGSLIGPDGAARIDVSKVTVNFLTTLHMAPAMGRDFLPDEGRAGSGNVAMLSYAVWQSRFGGGRGVIGKPVNIDGNLYEVVGVLPKTLLYLPNRRVVDVLLPHKIDPSWYVDRNQMRTWDSIGRLKDGVTMQQARADFTALFDGARRQFSSFYGNGAELRLVAYQARITGKVRLVLMLLLGAVGCVLLIACANVANLLLARGAGRQRELAVRVALGASRARLVRQLLVESLVLAFMGGAGGCAIAFAAVRVLRASAMEKLPRLGELTMDSRVLAFAVLLSLATAILFGMLPAVAATRADVSGRLKRCGRSPLGCRNSGVLVAGELALSLTLLVSAGLLLQSLWRLQHSHLGFDPESLVVTEVSLRATRFESATSQAFYPELRDRMARVPGTLAVAFADGLPPFGGSSAGNMTRPGRPVGRPQSRGDMVNIRHVSPDYFETLRIPLLRGRFFNHTDRNVAVINETLARRFFPGEDPIGQAFGANPTRTVIGIAADLKNDGLAGQPMPEWILPLEGATPDGAIRVAVRTRGEGHLVAAALRQALRQMDPRMLATVHTMQERFEDLTAQPRFNGVLFAAFAAVALTLAVVGIYGVVSFAVASRTREIGIRMALGADGGRVMRLVMRDASAPVAAGIAAGMLGSVAGGRYLATLLYDIKTTDPLTLVAVAALLATVAVGASLVPALRASHIDPNSILRAQ